MADPTLTEVIKKAIDQTLTNIHTNMPGTIESFDANTGLASVRPLFKRKYAEESAGTEYPVVSGVPVIFPRVANAFLRLPVAAGDKVLLVFAERSLDKWKEKGGAVSPGDPAKFALNDAVAIFGLYPKNDPVSANGAATSLEIAVGSSWIEIKTDGSINITASKAVIKSDNVHLGDETGSALAKLSDLSLLTVPGALGGGPGLPVSAAAAVGTIKTKAS